MESVWPSPFGVIVRGVAVAEVSARTTGFAPIVPVAGRTVSPPEIVHEYRPAGTVEASQVQSTVWPVPVPVATTAPVESATDTVHGSDWLNRA